MSFIYPTQLCTLQTHPFDTPNITFTYFKSFAQQTTTPPPPPPQNKKKKEKKKKKPYQIDREVS